MEVDYQIVKSFAPFAQIGTEELISIAKKLAIKDIEKGSVIIRQRDTGDCMFFLVSGQVDIWIEDEQGGRVDVAHLKKGDFFGEMAILTVASIRTATVEAVESCKVLCLYKKDFDFIIEKHPSIALILCRVLSERLALTNKHLLGKTAWWKEAGRLG